MGHTRSTRLLAFVALLGALAISVPSQATTVPIPKGVVAGIETGRSRCFEDHCDMYTNFKQVRIIGRLRGVQVVASATLIQYLSVQHFCPNNCPPTTPLLTKPFTISGTTVGGAPFAGSCNSGSIQQAFPEEGVYMPIVTARCMGGTSASQGGFALKFLHPTWGALFTPFASLPFVGVQVEA
ncbi:MAG TPA: hypothetical protein VJ979_11845 [Actinomycetota bacterium]|nr:hypothetical protein [Actinomycetota bacterium]